MYKDSMLIHKSHVTKINNQDTLYSILPLIQKISLDRHIKKF